MSTPNRVNLKDILLFKSFRSEKDKVCVPADSLTSSFDLKDEVPEASSHTTAASSNRVEYTPQSLTVVELFQSQGCSSCPPANDNVIRLADDPDKLVLTYEVTYWDYLGWSDTFGSKDWDARQRDYSAAFKSRNVYTPQVIVNGLSNGVGSRQRELAQLIADGQASPYASSIGVSVENGQVTIGGTENIRGIVQLVLYDSRTHNVPVARGENGGRSLPHRNIVREILVLGWWEGGKTEFPLPKWEDANLRAAILVQRGRGGPVIGACRVL